MVWADEPWRFDVLRHQNGHTFEGLIVEEKGDEIQFKHIIRRPGAKTVVLDLTFQRDEIQSIQRLAEKDRAELAARVAQLDRGGERERQRIRELVLEEIRWPNDQPARRYTCKHFLLESDLREDLVRLAVVRLEDIFQAFADRFGSRRSGGRVTLVLLFRSEKDYKERLTTLGLNILNPACFDPRSNTILAVSDFEQRAAEYEAIRAKHEALLRELESQEKKLRQHFFGKPPRGMLLSITQARRTIHLLNAENESLLERQRRPLFTLLAHEAFHAYVESHLYPAEEGGLPHWLNEGLAQVYESAVVDGGELRVGSIDARRLQVAQELLRKSQLPGVLEVLKAEPRQFQLAHRQESPATDRLFLACWGLAHYLAFHRKVLTSDRIDAYLAARKRGSSEEEAFRLLADEPLMEFEAQFRQYLQALRSDGTVRKGERTPP
ncbi:MAG: DUF1570 domain-containing protein [Gemmatales bacterium]|nr:DUF1570 domain-containing protein [Gemmatales bacterium]MDW8388127.1 DUF1570 domain-containing protein [Gemmatales bacterium]